MVIAREPGGGAVGLAGDQHTIGELFPAHFAPQAAARRRVALVADVQGEGLVGEQRTVGVDDELLGPLGEPAHPAPVELDLGGPQPGQVQDDRRRRELRDGVQDGVPGEAVAADPVVQIEFVPGDAVGVGPVARHVGVRGAGFRAGCPADFAADFPLISPPAAAPLLLGALVLNGRTFGCGAGGRAQARA